MQPEGRAGCEEGRQLLKMMINSLDLATYVINDVMIITLYCCLVSFSCAWNGVEALIKRRRSRFIAFREVEFALSVGGAE